MRRVWFLSIITNRRKKGLAEERNHISVRQACYKWECLWSIDSNYISLTQSRHYTIFIPVLYFASNVCNSAAKVQVYKHEIDYCLFIQLFNIKFKSILFDEWVIQTSSYLHYDKFALLFIVSIAFGSVYLDTLLGNPTVFIKMEMGKNENTVSLTNHW